MEGQLTCSRDQAVLLASHAVQSEFGDHDSDKHTAEFYGEYILFPPALEPTNEKEKVRVLREMNDGVMKNHRKHRGTSPASAEMAYIRIAQQLPEYGHESLPARDGDGHGVEVGACFLGVFLKQSNMLPKQYFR
jgi:tyrosine-protein phosphatase non-receptor type 14/21